ncbi:hypothetical protein HDU76_006018 [Blyttiomyces sp. JEL0837]|nr:hypothetical protein HDU76_006018 [Blyttiomyces sp. JEL0837]
MSCRPCSGFFPPPAIGSMSLLPAASQDTGNSSNSNSFSLSTPIIVCIALGGIALIVILSHAIVYFTFQRNRNSSRGHSKLELGVDESVRKRSGGANIGGMKNATLFNISFAVAGATFVWTNADPTQWWWNATQPIDFFPNYTIQISLSSPSSASTATISLPPYVLPSQQTLGAVTTYFHVAPMSRYQDQGLAPGLWEITVQAYCGFTTEQITQHCPGVNPMSCRPCSGFFPAPAVGSMSLLPAAKTTPTAVSSSSLSSGGTGTGGVLTGTARSEPDSSSSSTTNSISTLVIAGIVTGVAILISVIGALVFFALRRRQNSKLEMTDINSAAKDAYARGGGGVNTASKGGVGNGVDESQTIVYVPLEREEQEMDLFAVEAARGVGAPPPSYDHVAAVVQRSIASEGTFGVAALGSDNVLGGGAWISEKGGRSELFDGAVTGGRNEYPVDRKMNLGDRRDGE